MLSKVSDIFYYGSNINNRISYNDSVKEREDKHGFWQAHPSSEPNQASLELFPLTKLLILRRVKNVSITLQSKKL